MIRLGRSLGQHRIGLLAERLGHQVFELARLVAAGGKTGAVVALDPKPRTGERGAEACHGLQWGGELTETNAWKLSQVHGDRPVLLCQRKFTC
jgi:hypothetical protein